MNYLYSLIFCSLAWTATAQTTITSAVRPAVGDSFIYRYDTVVGTIILGNPGPNQNWDFSSLNSNVRRSEVYLPKNAGVNAASFPTADAVVFQGITEMYYRMYANRVDLLGTATRGGGPIPGLGGANVFPKPATVLRYPEHYLDTLSYQTISSVAFSSSILPDSLLNSLPLKPDSFRVNFNTKFHKEADAWGTLKLPAKSWEVLREKINTISKTTIDAKVQFLGWIDVTTLASGLFAGFFGDLNTTAYAFISNETKGYIAYVATDSLGLPAAIQYKPDDRIQLQTANGSNSIALSIYPNPTQDLLVLSNFSLPSGSYNYHVLDVNGKTIQSASIQLTENESHPIQLRGLKSGNYIFKLMDTKSVEIGTARFIVGQQ